MSSPPFLTIKMFWKGRNEEAAIGERLHTHTESRICLVIQEATIDQARDWAEAGGTVQGGGKGGEKTHEEEEDDYDAPRAL